MLKHSLPREFADKFVKLAKDHSWPNTILAILSEFASSVGVKFALLIGPLLVIIAIALISMTVFAFYNEILPMLHKEMNIVPFAILCLIGHWLLVNVVFNYLMAIKTNPGFPNKSQRPYDPAYRDPNICIKTSLSIEL